MKEHTILFLPFLFLKTDKFKLRLQETGFSPEQRHRFFQRKTRVKKKKTTLSEQNNIAKLGIWFGLICMF